MNPKEEHDDGQIKKTEEYIERCYDILQNKHCVCSLTKKQCIIPPEVLILNKKNKNNKHTKNCFCIKS